MTRPNASLIQQLIRFSSHPPVALMGLALVGVAAGQASPVEASIERSAPIDGVMPQVSPQPVSAAGSISATAISPAISAAPQFSSSRESEVLLAQSIEAAADGTGSVVTQTGSTFAITGGTQTGANLFHSFEQLGLDAGQTANFLSNPAIQNILGRVVGGDASVINGLLQVTGGNANLFLMNPAGIVFGPNAQVIVPGAFTATTAEAIQLGDYWFNALGTNDYANLVGVPSGFAFTSSAPGALINAGNLSGESVTLLGGFVVNTGTIEAPGGNITVAAVPGENLVRITQEGSLLSLDLPTEARDGLNSAGQTLTTLEIPDLLGGGSTPQGLGLVVQDGVVKLASTNTTLPTEAGTAIASGLLDASDTAPGSTGGTIDVLGNRVALLDATLQVSGSAGGGTARVGGDYRGQGTVPNAEQTYVGAGSTIAADALAEGDGGRVIVWANDATRFYGAISARGGADSGDGGFAEVSGRETLVFDGTADLGATNGAAGILLLDPRKITIADVSTSTDGVDSELPDIFANNPLGGEITISAAALTRQEGDVILQATDDIIVAPGLSLTFATCNSFPCSIEFRADADGDGVGSFLMDRTQSIIAPGRSVTISGSAVISGNIVTQIDAFSNGETVKLVSSFGSISSGDISAEGNVILEAINQGASISVGNITASGGVDMSADQNIFAGSIESIVRPSSEDSKFAGVYVRTASGNIRVISINADPGIIEVTARGLFQVTGYARRIGTEFLSRQPTIDIDLPENFEVKNFLISEGILDESGNLNDDFIDASGNVFVDEDGKPASRSSGTLIRPFGSSLIILEDSPSSGSRRLVRLDISAVPVSILAGTDNSSVVADFEARINISHSGQNAERSDSIRIGSGNAQFVVGPRVETRTSQNGNNFSFQGFGTDPLDPSYLAIKTQDYFLLPFGSSSFPEEVSGSVGAIFIGLGTNTFVGPYLLGVEYEPSRVVEQSQVTTVVDLALSNESDLSDQDLLEEEADSEDSTCKVFESTDVLSVSEVAPEECQAQLPSDLPLVEGGPSLQLINHISGASTEDLALPSEASLSDQDVLKDETNLANNACQSTETAEVLSVSELEPAECQL